MIGILIALFGVLTMLFFNLRKPLTVSNYVINTYTYIILALLIITLVVSILTYVGGGLFWTAVCATFISLIVLFFIENKHVYLRHALWLIFVLSIGVIMSTTTLQIKDKSIIWKSIMTVIVLIICLTFIASFFSDDYFDSWGNYLFISLAGVIIFMLIDFLFDYNGHFSRSKLLSIIIVIIFSGYVLYDTKKIKQHAIHVINSCGKVNSCANYPVESLGLFLDIINLFASFLNLYR